MRTLFTAGVHHAPDLALLALGYVQRAVRRLCHAVSARHGAVWCLQVVRAGEAIGKDLELTRGLAVREGLEGDVVAFLRKRRTIPRSMEGDEGAALVLLRELRAAVEHHVDRRPVRRKRGHRHGELGAVAPPLRLAVAAVLGIQ